MSEFLWEELWWNMITGPHFIVSKVVDALICNHMVILMIPVDLPWRHAMRMAIEMEFRGRLNNDIIIEQIDVVDDNPNNDNPGEFILSRFATPAIKLGYRKSVSIQDYISCKGVIKNRVVWVNGLREETAKQWIDFCRGFKHGIIENGLFVLEIQGDKAITDDVQPLELIDYKKHISSYDVQLFNSFILNNQKKYNDVWKKYIAALVADVCDTDAEISAKLLEIVNFKEQSVLDGVRQISKMQEYKRRGEAPNHILSLCRNGHIEQINQRIWTAQVQVLFPIIELERVRIIEKYKDEIQDVLDYKSVRQFEERLKNAFDAELGTLCYLMNQWLYGNQVIPYENERARISFLRKCRNQLAHGDCCTPEQVTQLLDY